MAKKAKSGSTRRGATKASKFSLVALHNQLAKVLERLDNAPNTPAAKKLREDIKALRDAKSTDCGQDMVIDI